MFIIPQSPAFNTRIVLSNWAMSPVWTVRRDCTISTYLVLMNVSYIHSFATSAYPRVPAGIDRAAMAGSEALALFTCLCAPALAFRLLLQSKQIPLLEFATRPPLGAGIRLGLAQRERVRSPRSASDDVIFDVRNVGQMWMTTKLKETVAQAITWLTST